MYRRRPGARTVAVAPGVVAAATPLIFEEAEGKAIANLDSHARASGSLGVESRPVLLEGTRIGSSRDHLDVTVHRLTLDGDYDASLVLLTGLARHLCADSGSPLGHLGGPEDMAFALPSRDPHPVGKDPLHRSRPRSGARMIG